MKRKVWKLVDRPEGLNFEDALSLVEEDIDTPNDNKILIKTKIISMDAGTRMWMSDREDSYQPPIDLGANMVGVCLAEVIESSENATAVGPVNKFSNFLNLLPSSASFVILFFVILKSIPCFLISALNSSICFTVKP